MRINLLTILVLCFAVNISAYAQQNVGIGTNTPNTSALLDLTSTNKGLLIPRVTQTQRNNIVTPANGLLVYQTDNTTGFYYYNGSSWQTIGTGGGGALTLPFSQSFGGSLLGSRVAMQIDPIGTYGETAFRSDVKNNGAVGFFGKAFALGSTAAKFTIDTSTALTGRYAMITEDGNVVLNLNSGKTGIGVVPNYLLDIAGRIRLQAEAGNISAGIWYNKTNNSGLASFSGQITDTTWGLWHAEGSAWRIGFDYKNARLGIGMITPAVPLNFSNAVGNKIALWGADANQHYGLGIQGSLLQIYADQSGSDISFGYGSSSNFTENMRIKGSGAVGIGTTNPASKLEVSANTGNSLQLTNTTTLGSGTTNSIYFKNGSYYTGMIRTTGVTGSTASLSFYTYANSIASGLRERLTILDDGKTGIGVTTPTMKLDVFGRVRLYHTTEDGTAGLWFNKANNTQGSFIGQYDDTNFGIWGPGATGSWKFLFDGNDGTLRIGTTQKATGYLVNVGGKVIAEEVRVQVRAAWPDYVFDANYGLKPLNELEAYINEHHHLPGIASAKSIEKEGIELGQMNKQLMEKVEELTLYVIQLKKEIDTLKSKQ